MGLDNGIIIKRKDNKELKLPSFVKPTDIYTETGEIELAYWRKCIGLRNEILALYDDENEKGCYKIDGYILLEIIKILINFLHKDYWEKNSNSPWDWEDIVEKNEKILINLCWLSWQMLKEENELEVYFYDSY